MLKRKWPAGAEMQGFDEVRPESAFLTLADSSTFGGR